MIYVILLLILCLELQYSIAHDNLFVGQIRKKTSPTQDQKIEPRSI